jgi:alanyl-tRNA synthetase
LESPDLTGDEIREAFLRFFESKGHLRIPSSSLIPAGDPTLLLTNAGMVQFKPYFTGEMTPPGRRLTSVQKCFRTTDIDSVGDSTHLTFFEMLGNFSVGDYFKREAIEYAWEFVTEHLKLEKGRLWATVFVDDDEALGYWTETGIPAERIRRFDEKDNFWGPAGSEGPCGPCSEIHYDFGEGLGCCRPGCGPNCENVAEDTGLKCDRFVELWNLVFMQYYQAQDGSRMPLPAPNIDTGMGLERCAVILQGKRSIYETDLFQPLVQKVAELAGKQYGQDPDADYAMRVVAEHARSAAFLIADGVVPGNEGRGYVLRRVIRRAIRYGKKLGLEAADSSVRPVGAIHESPLPVEPRAVLPQVAEVVIERMKAQYPDLGERREFILRVMALEEERFGRTFERGLVILSGMVRYRMENADLATAVIEAARKGDKEGVRILSDKFPYGTDPAEDYDPRTISGEYLARAGFVFQVVFMSPLETPPYSEADINRFEEWQNTIGGTEMFLLYTTYGFPPELTREMAREHGMNVDMEYFQLAMEDHKRESRGEGEKFGGDFDAVRAYQDLGVGSTTFLGYETLNASPVVVGMLRVGQQVSQST